MIYVNQIKLPTDAEETGYIMREQRTCFHTFYPFKIFADKGLTQVKFDNITIFYGGNGSGKSTLINVMARKMKSVRFSDFNDAPLFNTYVKMCRIDYYNTPKQSCVLTSDDVFDYVLKARCVNGDIDDRRNAVMKHYRDVHEECSRNPDIMRLHGLNDYERWKHVSHILSSSMSSQVRESVERDVDLESNGETAMQYFVDRIENEGVYFLDEPENSLSIEFQMKLVEYILATSRAIKTQFIIATHSPIFLSMEGAKIYNLDAYPVKTCEWTQLPNVRKYYDFFLSHREEFENDSDDIDDDSEDEMDDNVYRTNRLPRSSPYWQPLMDMIVILDELVGISEDNQVLIVLKLTTDEKVQKWFDWIYSKIDGDDIRATEVEIVRAAVKIDKGIEPK